MSKARIIFIFLGISLFTSLPGLLHGQSLYEVRRASFTSMIYDDYAPVYFRGGLLFTSNRRSSAFVAAETQEGIPTSNIYFVPKKDSLNWGRARIFDNELVSLFNEGPACYDSVHQLLYFTRNLILDPRKKDVVNNYGIFIAQWQDGKVGNTEAFPFNDASFKTGHPALTPGGDTLFFVSDRPGGYGQADIYMTVKDGGVWSEPVNLGAEVNSDSSELFPFWHASGRLYFASDRSGGMGGLDIYFTRFIHGAWIKPVLLKEPFNSGADDFGLIADERFATGLFTSSRNGKDNIFTFNSLIPVNPACKAMEAPVNCFQFYETQSMGIDTIPVIYQWDFGDGNRAFGHTATHCYDNPGTYLARLNVTDTITGEVRRDVATYLVEVVKVEQAIIEAPDSCFIGEEINLKGSVDITGFEAGGFFWNFGDGDMAEGESVRKTYYDPGVHTIQLTVKSQAQNERDAQQTCVTRKITVKLK